jgi:peptidoglycan/LPS O-acetylase OafA/YrhL
MNYRREIDGLRALAVLPVILFHAGFETFRGGFVGVDVFFVISGYLITTITLAELAQDKFSIINFYERRARRILPALFLVMFVSLVFGYMYLMPDEFKNFGQSLVATSLFSNNILLSSTSGYWSLDSEFKPLLHTWSLGVEEQYYVIVPILLMLFWRFNKNGILYLLWTIFLTSLCFSIWFVNISPDWAFYNLPTRAWEICIGALSSLYLSRHPPIVSFNKLSDVLSFTGFVLIFFAVVTFNNKFLSPSYLFLIPTIGAVLVILFCQPGTFVFKILANKIVVFVGLLSYSLYLWHQPIFAYFRVFSLAQPSPLTFLSLFPVIFVFSFLTWKLVESPFRIKAFLSRKNFFYFALSFSILFIVIGLFLNKNYGMPLRVFDHTISISDMDKRIYNERVYSLKKSGFSKASLTKILIIGNSFARDFTNITLENFDVRRVEIVYRNDLQECIEADINKKLFNLFVEADVIVFASGGYSKDCYSKDISFALSQNKKIFYIGTKEFGYNLNWLIRLSKNERFNKFNTISAEIISADKKMSEALPQEHFISLLTPTLVNGKIPITDELGRMLSTDRRHLTKYGAVYFGKKAVIGTSYSELFR